MELAHIENSFIDIGGQFFTSGFDMREKLSNIEAIIFDWDGLFNNGVQNNDNEPGFSEVDATGVEMLRLGFYMAFGKMVKTGIITSSINLKAHEFGNREHFNNVYCESRDKAIAFQHFMDTHKLQPSQVICLFSDVNDAAIARQAAISFVVGRACNPVFMEYLIKDRLVDYISSCHGDENAVREFSELLLGLLDNHFDVMDERAHYGQSYIDYGQAKAMINTNIHKCDSSNILTP